MGFEVTFFNPHHGQAPFDTGTAILAIPFPFPDFQQAEPFVERCIRTLKHECLYPQLPEHVAAADQQLTHYRGFYNAERANQALSCGNCPPLVAFPNLPSLPIVPEVIDPDRWLERYDRRIFRRWVSSNGTVMVDKYIYLVGASLAGQRVALHLDAQQRKLHVQHHGQVVKSLPLQGIVDSLMSFPDYLRLMLEEARSLERYLRQKALQTRG